MRWAELKTLLCPSFTLRFQDVLMSQNKQPQRTDNPTIVKVAAAGTPFSDQKIKTNSGPRDKELGRFHEIFVIREIQQSVHFNE